MRKLPVFEAFRHILLSTFRHLPFAFYASWPWMLLLTIMTGVIWFMFQGLQPEEMMKPEMQSKLWAFFGINLIRSFIFMVAFASMAVAWHRYILLDEVPHGWKRLRIDWTVWRYAGNSFIIIILIFIAAIAVSFLVFLPFSIVYSILYGANGSSNYLNPTYVVLFFTCLLPGLIILLYRLSVKLPAVAMERTDFGLPQAMAATAGNNLQILGLGLLLLLISLVFGVVLNLGYVMSVNHGWFATLLLVLASMLLQWVNLIMGITTLTSLYGFFVQKRSFPKP